jgi:hypothetical protein
LCRVCERKNGDVQDGHNNHRAQQHFRGGKS